MRLRPHVVDDLEFEENKLLEEEDMQAEAATIQVVQQLNNIDELP